MPTFQRPNHHGLAALVGLSLALTTSAWSREVTKRVISRADLAGTDKEILLVETTIPPGVESPRHTHPGEEAFYVVQGSMTQFPGKAPTMREAGTGGINAREVPHAGYKVVGDTPLKIVNVYIVDKGKPLSTPAQ